MKFTRYFAYRRKFSDRCKITDEMISSAISNPIKTEVQIDGRIRMWAKIEQRFLRVILLEDGETVHNAFFDRKFKVKS